MIQVGALAVRQPLVHSWVPGSATAGAAELAIDVADSLRDRAVSIVKEGHTPQQIMQSAMADLKGMGSLTGLMGIMQTGQFSPQQMVLAERLAVKIIAYCALSKK